MSLKLSPAGVRRGSILPLVLNLCVGFAQVADLSKGRVFKGAFEFTPPVSLVAVP